MKTVLIAAFLQILPGPTPETSEIRVMAAITAEFDSRDACRNAINGIVQLAEASGFKANALCTPKDIGRLEVEKPKGGKG